VNYVVLDFEVNSLKSMEVIETSILYEDGTVMNGLSSSKDPLCPSAQSVHHIRTSELEGKPNFDQSSYYREIKRLIDEGYYFVCHNISFEDKVLKQYEINIPEDQLICTQAVITKFDEVKKLELESHSLQYLRYFFNLEEELDELVHTPAHRATTDVKVTHLLFKYLKRESKREDYLKSFNEITKEFLLPENYIIRFGKHVNKKLITIYNEDPNYLNWLLKNIDKEDILEIIVKFYDQLESK
jgi:DNA polymerase III epsilon subunit-like protein